MWTDTKVDNVDILYAADWNDMVIAVTSFINSKGVANGLATLDVDGHVPATQLPSNIVNVQSDWNESSNISDAYILNKPTIPAAQVQSDWNAIDGMGVILNKPTLGSIASHNTDEFATTLHNHDASYLGINAKASDSNLLDGQDSSYFATSGHLHTGIYEPANANIQSHISSTSNPHSVTYSQVGAAPTSHVHGSFDNSTALTGANVYSLVTTEDGIVTGLTSRTLTASDVGAAPTSHIHAQSDVTNLVTDMATKAPLASPTFTGVPLAPTPAANTNTTQIATTAYVLGQASATTPMKPTMDGSIGTSTLYARADHVHPSVTPFNTLTCSQDVERRFFKDDFSNNTIAAYTLTGAPSIASGVLTLATTEKAIKTLNTADTTGKWECTVQFTTTYSVDQSCKLYFGATSYLDIQRKTGNVIYLQLTVNGSSVIASTSASATLTDSTDGRGHITYDGTNYQMYWNGVAVGSATAGSAPTTPSIGILATASTVVVNEITYSPSVAWADPFTSDTEARYMQLSAADITMPSPTGTWAAAIAGDVVVSGGKMTLASTASTYQEALCSVLRSYNFGSGEYEFAFDNNNDGGGGADSCGLVFGYQDILNHYKLVLNDDAAGAETLKLYKVVAGTATQLGSTADVSSSYTRGNKTWLKLHWDAVKGRMWVYLRDDAGVYSTTPNIADAFSAAFNYGKCGFWAAVTTAGESNLNIDFYPVTIRALSLIGETNVPATESNFYFRDEFGVDSSARMFAGAGGVLAVSGGTLNLTLSGPTRGYVSTRAVRAYLGSVVFAQINCVSTTAENKRLGLVLDWDGTIVSNTLGNGYTIQLYFNSVNKIYIHRYVNGVSTQLGEFAFTCSHGVEYYLKAIHNPDGTISVYCDTLDGSILVGTSTSDLTFSNGYCGFAFYQVTDSNANFAINNFIISGTRYYNQPMLRGCQIGEYWDGSASVPCTRFTDDFDWNTGAEWAVGGETATFDTTNGQLTLSGTGGNFAYVVLNSNLYTNGYYSATFLPITSASNQCWLIIGSDSLSGYRIQFGSISINLFANTTSLGTYTFTKSLNIPTTIGFLWNGSQKSVYVDGVLAISVTDSAVTSAGKLILAGYRSGVHVTNITRVMANAIESTSGNNPVCIGGVPHGARYDTQEYAVRSFTNAVRYGEYRLASAIKTTNASAEDIELYLKNATDSSYITDDSSDTVAVALSDTNWANVTKNAFLNADDVSDTITIQARRKTAATDNSPACLVDFVELLPIVEVG